MRALSSAMLAGCSVLLALGSAAPAAAQGYPGYGYGYGYGPNPRAVIHQCTRAVQERIGGYGAYGGGRVVRIRQVGPGPDGGLTVRGVASIGGYDDGERGPELNWRCSADGRGFVRQVNVYRSNPGYGYYNQGPRYDDDFSEYGYHRY